MKRAAASDPMAQTTSSSVLRFLAVGLTLSASFLRASPSPERLHQAARLGPWKAVRHGLDQPIELYDLVADPEESTNVAARHPETAAALRAILDSSHVPSPHWPVR